MGLDGVGWGSTPSNPIPEPHLTPFLSLCPVPKTKNTRMSLRADLQFCTDPMLISTRTRWYGIGNPHGVTFTTRSRPTPLSADPTPSSILMAGWFYVKQYPSRRMVSQPHNNTPNITDTPPLSNSSHFCHSVHPGVVDSWTQTRSAFRACRIPLETGTQCNKKA